SPGMGKPGWQFEPGASRQSRKRPQPYKRCAASARRRSYRSSLWLLFAEFLEARIIPQRIEHRIEPEQRRSERRLPSTQRTLVRDREQFLQGGPGAIRL